MSDTTDNSNLIWWACIVVIAGMIALNILLYQLLQETRRGWLRQVDATSVVSKTLGDTNKTLTKLQVDTQLHQEREAYHWRQHPGDRVIPGPGRGRGIGEPFGQPPLTEPEEGDDE